MSQDYRLMDVIDTKEGILTVGPARKMLFSAQAYIYLVRSIYQHAPHAVKYLLYDVGYQTGLQYMSSLANLSVDMETLVRLGISTFTQAGYGHFELVEYDLDQRYIRIIGKNLFEASLSNEIGIYRTPRTVDHYSRGMFAGLFSKLLGEEVVCEEMRCEARGEEACEFVVMPFTNQ